VKKTDIGILLHRVTFSESSWITTFYTQKMGIQQFIFRGAKRKKYNLFPLNVCELTYYVRSDSELGKLTHIDTELSHTMLFSDPRKHIIAFFIADVIRKSLRTTEVEPHLFQFFKQTITEINQADILHSLPLNFLADFTTYIGIRPNQCDNNPVFFDLEQGEFFSKNMSERKYVESGQVARELFLLFFSETNHFIEYSVIRKQVLNVLLRYYATHIPNFNINKSLEIIREILQDTSDSNYRLSQKNGIY